MAGARGDPESVGAEALRPVTEVEFPFAAVDLVVGIMVLRGPDVDGGRC